MTTANIRKTPQEIIEQNKKIIEENNLKTWSEVHAFVLQQRTGKAK